MTLIPLCKIFTFVGFDSKPIICLWMFILYCSMQTKSLFQFSSHIHSVNYHWGKNFLFIEHSCERFWIFSSETLKLLFVFHNRFGCPRKLIPNTVRETKYFRKERKVRKKVKLSKNVAWKKKLYTKWFQGHQQKIIKALYGAEWKSHP